MTWDDWMRAHGRSPETIRVFRSVIRRWIAATADPHGATHIDLARWLSTMPHLSPSSVATYRKALRSWYAWLQWSDLRPDNPADRVPRPATPPGRPRPLPMIDAARVIDAAGDPVLRLWLCLATYEGLRRGEIARLGRGDVDAVTVRVRRGKGGRSREVPTHPATWRAAMAVTVWPEVSPHTVGVRVAAHLRACGVDATCHQLRHTFGTGVYRGSGGDLLLTQRLLGHSSVTSTQVYAEPDDRARDVVAGLAA